MQRSVSPGGCASWVPAGSMRASMRGAFCYSQTRKFFVIPEEVWKVDLIISDEKPDDLTSVWLVKKYGEYDDLYLKDAAKKGAKWIHKTLTMSGDQLFWNALRFDTKPMWVWVEYE